ncbi:MAG: DUF2723 domain-containing protein [Bdellovibrionales bacterium]|nr:DUF2723 domain-containing protein [Bdellovibrionales bacterium]
MILWSCILAFIFLSTSIFYFPGWFDSPELVLAIETLGVSHPPGQPIYLLLAKPFTYLPLGTVAYRTSLFSLTCFIVANFFFAKTIVRLLDSYSNKTLYGCVFIALAVFSPELVLQSNRTELYALCMCLSSIIIYLVISYEQSADARLLLIAAFVLGCFMLVHPVLALPHLIAPVAIIRSKKNLKHFIVASLFLMTASLILLYMPLRATTNPSLNWGDPKTLRAFLHGVFALDYSSFHVPSLKIKTLLSLLTHHLGITQLSLTFLGLILLFKNQKKRVFTLFLIVIATSFIFSLRVGFYSQNPDSYGYIANAILLIHLLAVLGVIQIKTLPTSSKIKACLIGVSILVLIMPKLKPARAVTQISGGQEVALLSQAPLSVRASSIFVLSSDHWIFPMWYRNHLSLQASSHLFAAEGLMNTKWYQKKTKNRFDQLKWAKQLFSEQNNPKALALYQLLQHRPILTNELFSKCHAQDIFKIEEGMCAQLALFYFKGTILEKHYSKGLLFLESYLNFPKLVSRKPDCKKPKNVNLPFQLESHKMASFLPTLSHLRNEYLLLYLGCYGGVEKSLLQILPNETLDDRNWKKWLL